jgi:hypothetical protein
LDDVTIVHALRKENKQTDTLANLASNLCLHDQGAQISIGQTWIIPHSFEDEDDERYKIYSIFVYDSDEKD